MRREWAALLGLALSCLGVGAHAAAPPDAGAAAPWKLIYENSQTAYYVDARGVQPTGQSDVAVLQNYKVAQVVDGAQVWSVVSAMKVTCDQNLIMTLNNTLYALKSGAGPVVSTQVVPDTWHTPQPDSLGGVVLGAVCPKP
jgi:hypothetical protein